MRHVAPPQKFVRPALRPGARAGTAFIANLSAVVAQIRANAPGVIAGQDVEHLHQLRVGIRRLRSTLRVFRALIKRKQADRFERRLQAVLGTLGTARDWDVFEHAFTSPSLRRHSHRRAEAARRRARATVRSAHFRFLPDEILAWARGMPWRDATTARETLLDFARRALDRMHARLSESAEGIDWRDTAGRHHLRIRVKRLRYGCECFASAWPEEAMESFLKQLKRLQEILGDLNDIEVQRLLLQDLAGAGATKAQLGAAVRTLARREQPSFARLRRAWRAFVAVGPYWLPPEAADPAQ